ncbi:hypothetical protein BVY03_04840 [bacterium K02(2017)]|nr:hypothetical protein BVY03_04840 [bacterium K02(2017)]
MNQKITFGIALFGLFLGVLIAIVFGVNESFFKDRIQKGLQKNIKIQAMADPIKKQAKLTKEASKNWRYYQRFHFHSTGIGAMSLGILILLLYIAAPTSAKVVSAYAISLGGFFYPFIWLFAAIYGPEMGRHQAKECFAVFGYMGGVFLLGILLTMVLLFKYELKLPKHESMINDK